MRIEPAVKAFFRRPSVRTSGKALVTVFIFVYLFTRLDVYLIGRLISQSRIWLLLVTFALFASRVLLGAYRNKVLLAYKSFIFSVTTLTRFYYIGFFFNLFLPTVVGGDIARGYYLYRYSGGRKETISSILVERALGIVAMMLLSLFSVFLAVLLGLDVLRNDTIKIIVIAFGAGLVLAVLYFHEKTAQVFEKMLPAFIADRFASVVSVIRNVIEYNRAPRILGYVLLISIVFQLSAILCNYLIALAIGCTTPFLYFLMLLPVVWLISMIPVTINGLGLREGAFVYLFGTTGMAQEMAMTISLLWFAQTVGLSIIGGLVFLTEGSSMASIKNYGSS